MGERVIARDGSGNYSRVVTPPNNGDVADADDYNAELDDVSTALSDSINRSGTKAFAADQSMGGYKLTNLGTPTSNGDAVSKTYLEGRIGVSIQAYDATLTALAALSWSSGQNFLTFTAADTVSLTNTISMAGLPARFVNTTDNASVQALRIEGDRATPASGDGVYLSFYLSDAAGNQDEIARIAVVEWDATSTSEDGEIDFHIVSAGTLAARAVMTATAFRPNANDGMALGTAAVSFSDLFGATGFTWNIANGNWVATHSSGAMEVTTGTFRSRSARSATTGGTLTSASSNKVVVLATAPTIDGNVHTADDIIALYNNTGSAMTMTQGTTGTPTQRLHGTATTGNLTLAARGWAYIYFITATEWVVSGDVS